MGRPMYEKPPLNAGNTKSSLGLRVNRDRGVLRHFLHPDRPHLLGYVGRRMGLGNGSGEHERRAKIQLTIENAEKSWHSFYLPRSHSGVGGLTLRPRQVCDRYILPDVDYHFMEHGYVHAIRLMLLLIDGIFIALIIGVGVLAAQKVMQRGNQPQVATKKKEYVPPIVPDLPVGGPERRIRTHDIGHFYDEIGRPTEIGTQVEVNMNSGMIAIFELVHKERATGVDWNWYDLEFIRYKDSTSSSPNRT